MARESCVVNVSRKGDIQPGPVCYASYSEMLTAQGYQNVPVNADPAINASEAYTATPGTAAAAAFQLATFHDLAGNGADLTINGNDCAGGFTHFNSTWDNRFDEVTHKACKVIRHHYFACDSTPDFTTTGNPGDLVVYAITAQNKEDCASFHNK